jgi:hypothetical protein
MHRDHYPRVSDIIGIQTAPSMRQIPIEVLANAAERGIRCHAHCMSHAMELFPAEILPEDQPYVEAFTQWYDANVSSLVLCETRFYDDKLEFCGQPDMVVNLKNGKRNVLLDLKFTASPSISWPVQFAAYKHLLGENSHDISEVYGIHLKKYKRKSGDVIESEEVFYSEEEMLYAWEVFFHCLCCYNYFNRKEIKDV